MTQKIKINAKKIRALIGALLFMIVAPSFIFAFDWPLKIDSLQNVVHFFAEHREHFISPSLVFPEGDVITISETGKLLFYFGEKTSCRQFPSSLGETLVLAHENDLRTVYANLHELKIDTEVDYLIQGSEIALSGDSGWHESGSGLEFSVIDIKNKAIINPLLVLPMHFDALSFSLGKIFARDIQGEYRELTNGKRFSEGVYVLYREVREKAPLYKSLVSVNGTVVDSITYDALYLWKEQLVIKSNRGERLPFAPLFPMENRQYLCEVKLSRGKNTIIVEVFDILGNKKQVQYSLDIY